MYQIDNPSAATVRPGTTPPGSSGYFTDGSAALAQQPTILPAEWLNALQDELLNILHAAGIAPDKTKFNQLVQALPIISGAQTYGFKNKLINGNFDFWQRATSGAAASGSRVIADRWRTNGMGATTMAVSQQSFALGQTAVPYNPKFFHRCVVASTAGAANGSLMWQPMEGAATFSGRQITVSFWAKADAAKNIAIEFQQYFGSGGSPSPTVSAIASQLVALTTAWQKFAITVTIPSVSGMTLGTNGDDSFNFAYWFDAGTNFAARAANLGQQSGTFDISQVQIEPGGIGTSFDVRQIEVELALCQRFYEKSYDTTVPPGAVTTAGITYNFISGLPSAVMSTGLNAVFKVTKRAVPTVQWYSPSSGTAARVRDSANNADIVLGTLVNSTTNALLNCAMSAANTQLNIQGHWTADSEL